MSIYDFKEQIDRYFHGKEGYNCAQTVLSILKDSCDISNITNKEIINAQSFGGGRAPTGYCGALYGALLASDDDNKSKQILNDFKKEIENLTCREIKQVNKKSCKECILAALNSFLNNN